MRGWQKRDKIVDFIYQYRFALAFFLFIVLILLKMNGSSMGCWQALLGEDKSGVLLGGPRAYRSDEWGALTPLCFRQQYNALGAYNRYSLTLGSIKTDNMLVYGQPAWDILTLFRPFYWGYLLFGSERGLTWFWCGRLIALFLSWFELGMLITDGQKRLSVMLSVCVSFAPFLQWWFAINGLAEMLIYGACFVLGTNYLVSKPFQKNKFLVAVGMSICAVGYVLTFYPTWMAPVAWGFVPLFLWVIFCKTDKKVLGKKDMIPWLIIIGITVAGVLVLMVSSLDVIKAELNSVYPGRAVASSGGGGLLWIMKYPISLLSKLNPPELIIENSSIICFAPAGFLLSMWVIFREKKRDPLLILLLVMNLFLDYFYCVGVPMWLSKIMLLSFTNANRGPQVLGFLRLTVLIRALSLKEQGMKRWLSALIAVLSSIIPVGLAWGFTKYDKSGSQFEYFDVQWKIIFVWIVLVIAFYLLYQAHRKKYLAAILYSSVVVFACSAWINPIAKGTPEITKSETMKAMREIVKEDPSAIWLVVDLNYPQTNLPAMVGADCFNTTQTYPQNERWASLDETGAYEDLYNRYCHIRASFGSEQDLQLLAADYVEVTFSPETLKKLNIKYIVSTDELDEKIADGTVFGSDSRNSEIEFQKCYSGARLSIYQCVY